jgi:hypothetical protein
VTKWRIGVMNCYTLVITYQSLDSLQLTEPEALSVVDRWNRLDAGRRLNWLVGRDARRVR